LTKCHSEVSEIVFIRHKSDHPNIQTFVRTSDGRWAYWAIPAVSIRYDTDLILFRKSIEVSASTFIKLDFLFSSLFIAIFPARNCKISWQISWHFLYLYLAFRSFPTISFTVTIHSLQKYDLKLKISANSVFILES
jgi:hypothetical protein